MIKVEFLPTLKGKYIQLVPMTEPDAKIQSTHHSIYNTTELDVCFKIIKSDDPGANDHKSYIGAIGGCGISSMYKRSTGCFNIVTEEPLEEVMEGIKLTVDFMFSIGMGESTLFNRIRYSFVAPDSDEIDEMKEFVKELETIGFKICGTEHEAFEGRDIIHMELSARNYKKHI